MFSNSSQSIQCRSVFIDILIFCRNCRYNFRYLISHIQGYHICTVIWCYHFDRGDTIGFAVYLSRTVYLIFFKYKIVVMSDHLSFENQNNLIWDGVIQVWKKILTYCKKSFYEVYLIFLLKSCWNSNTT